MGVLYIIGELTRRCGTIPPDRMTNMNNESQRKLKIETVYRHLILQNGSIIQILPDLCNAPQKFDVPVTVHRDKFLK